MLNACDLVTDVERAARWCTVADDFVERYGCPFLYAECRTLYGGVLVATGRWDDAERELDAALRITTGTCPALHTRALVGLADLRLRQGRLEQVDQLLAQLDRQLEAEAETALTRAALLLARGDGAGASRVLADRLDRLAHHRLHAATALSTLVDAHLAAGDLDAAADCATRLTSLATEPKGEGNRRTTSAGDPKGEADQPATGPTDPRDEGDVRTTVACSSGEEGEGDRVDALAAGARGRVALAGGDPVAAARELARALAVWVRSALPYETAACLVDLAGAVAASHPDLAVEHGRRALAIAEELGATEQADRAAARLRSLGVHARTGPKGVGVLTRREQEVLALLGQGLSNPEIAARLHVSRKTASHHVSSILSKLQLRNRAEAAVVAVGAAVREP
jgi:DNA-binding NarL/FixJ family response regulator